MPAATEAPESLTGLHDRVHDLRATVRQGRIGAALQGLAEVGAGPSAETTPELRAEVAALWVECLLARGDLDGARAWSERVGDLIGGRPGLLALHARGETAAAHESHEEAVALHLAAGEAETETAAAAIALAPGAPGVSMSASTCAWFVPWRSAAALALAQSGRRREATGFAETEHDLAAARGDRHDLARALRMLAATATDGHAVRRLQEAGALAQEAGAVRLGAQVDTDLAGLLVLQGEQARAVTLLRGAELVAARESLRPLQSRIRRWLEHVGEHPRRLEAEALAVLTAAERRVALLALDGWSNRQIAEHLVVSVKAVEGHLSKTYRKLDVTSRAGLSTAIGRPG